MGDIKASSHLYAGFFGGLASSVALQPLDLLKTRMQQTHGTSLTQVLKTIPSIRDLWRGTVPSAVRMSLGASMYMTLLGTMRTQVARMGQRRNDGYSSDLPKLSMRDNLLLGAFARSVVGFITMPATVIKVQYESSLYHYRSIRQAVETIYRRYGVRGFFSGYLVTVYRDAPYAGFYVLFYEKSKETLNTLFPSSAAYRPAWLSATINSSSALLAATLATTVTAPFDVIKTRVQLDPANNRTFVGALSNIVKHDGWMSLFNGLSLRLARKGLSAGISWCIYEELVRKLDRYGDKSLQ